jgi:hypothetical protein
LNRARTIVPPQERHLHRMHLQRKHLQRKHLPRGHAGGKGSQKSRRIHFTSTFIRVWLCSHTWPLGIICLPLAVLKQLHPDTGISNRSMSILNSFLMGSCFSPPVRLCSNDIMQIFFTSSRQKLHFVPRSARGPQFQAVTCRQRESPHLALALLY